MHQSDIDYRFAFHPATTEEKRSEHTSIRENCRELASFLNEKLPEGREKALAFTHLEEVMFWGNAAVARAKAAVEKLGSDDIKVYLDGKKIVQGGIIRGGQDA